MVRKYVVGGRKIPMAPECEECGNDLHVNSVDKPNVDWVKVVCSDCGNITNVSMVRMVSVKKNTK